MIFILSEQQNDGDAITSFGMNDFIKKQKRRIESEIIKFLIVVLMVV